MSNTKYNIFFLIIFSISCFGKQFDKLFTVYESIDNSSQIESAIKNSFDTMIHRLSGDESVSNIWKIINSGNARKDFIISYSIKTQNEKSFLEVKFDKNLLISSFNQLSIPIVGNSRPVILFIINVDPGSTEPYFVSNSKSNSELDNLIKNYLKFESLARGIFLEIPEIDLLDFDEFKNYKKLIDYKKFFTDKYVFDEIVIINISKIGLDKWIISRDMKLSLDNKNFNDLFMQAFNDHTRKKINNLLLKNRIDTSVQNFIEVSISNIETYEDYQESRRIMNNFIGLRDISIKKFNVNTIYYQLEIYGTVESFIKEVNENNFFIVNEIFNDASFINLDYIK